MPRNILFIMCDQLRWDYLSCYGHLKLNTPNIDSLAARGVRFDNAYCQAPICGPSRASFYTGRYMSSHGVMANPDPMRIDELTITDYLKPSGYRSALVGKAHNRKSVAAMRALGVNMESDFARFAGSGGFEPFELHDGLYPDGSLPKHHVAEKTRMVMFALAGDCETRFTHHVSPKNIRKPRISPIVRLISWSNRKATNPGACTFPISSHTGR
jgi:arylsulfatase A-like enzyme